MFELISGGPRHPFHDRTMAPTLVSVAGHVVVLTAVLVIPLLYATDRLPSVPTVMAFVAAEPVVAAPPPPPPPPPPSNVVRSKAAAARPNDFPTAAAIPVDAPVGIAPEPSIVAADTGGVEGGVEGGVIGGVVGGIVGGLVAAAPPPPPPLPPAAPPLKAPVRIGGNIQAPVLLHRVDPAYPDIAVVAKVGGMVILEATVGVDGAVESVRTLRGVKFLDQAAIDAVKQWRYTPLILNGAPTPSS